MTTAIGSIRALAFDLDGTLIETAPEICDAVNDTLQALGLPLVSQSQVNDWIGHGTRTLLVQALAWSQGLTEAEVRAADSLASAAAVFDQHYQARCGTRSQLYPQVRETLVALRNRGVKLAVVTNKEGRYTATVLNAHQLMPLLDRVVSGDTLPTKKPDPAGIASCLAEFGVAPARASTTNTTTSASATARSVCRRIGASMPEGCSTRPPVSTTT